MIFTCGQTYSALVWILSSGLDLRMYFRKRNICCTIYITRSTCFETFCALCCMVLVQQFDQSNFIHNFSWYAV